MRILEKCAIQVLEISLSSTGVNDAGRISRSSAGFRQCTKSKRKVIEPGLVGVLAKSISGVANSYGTLTHERSRCPRPRYASSSRPVFQLTVAALSIKTEALETRLLVTVMALLMASNGAAIFTAFS